MELNKILKNLEKDSLKKTKITQVTFNLKLAYKAIKVLGGDDFVIDQHNERVIKLLLAYFHGYPAFETAFPELKYKLHKGILLAGPIGTGKSTLMEIFRNYCKHFLPHHRYLLVDVRRVTNRFIKEGSIDNYTYDLVRPRMAYERTPTRNYCFDDLGTEPESVRYYGTEADPIKDLIMDRYVLYKRHGVITHATTNLDMKNLTERYGERAVSRMREMFNFIVLDGPDRRVN